MSSRTILTACAMAALLAGSRTSARAAAEKPAPKPQVEVAAVVNGEEITEPEVTAVVERELRGQQVPPNVFQQVRRIILEALISSRLVEQFLADQQIAVDPKEVDAAVKKLKERVAAAGLGLDEVLRRQGQTEQSLRSRLAGELAFRKYAESEISEQEVKDYFAKHKEEFDGTEVRASHLLIKLEQDATAEQKKAARQKIDAIRQEILQGLDFAAAAQKYSEGPSAAKGGDIGFFPRRGAMVEPFARAAFALEEDQVSEPVETRFGLHLIKVTDRKPGEKQLDEVRELLRADLRRDLWEQIAARQRQEAKIKIYE